jgi:osmotically-inducible protein OsmY
MKIDNKLMAAFTSIMIISGLTACDKPGPAETAGKKMDQVTENVTTAVSNSADKADKAMSEQGKATGQALDDTQITAKVKAALLSAPGLQSMKITVDTEKGKVTLSGSADSQMNIDKAVKATEAVEGVQSVKNKLMIAK